MSSHVPCHNPASCPAGGAIISHVVGSQVEQLCKRLAADTRPNRMSMPATPPADDSFGGTRPRRPDEADPYFLNSATWRETLSPGNKVAGWDYNPATGMMAVALADDSDSDDPYTNTLVYADVSPDTAEGMEAAYEDGRLDDEFMLEVEDDYEVVALGPQPAVGPRQRELVARRYAEASASESHGDAVRLVAERCNVDQYVVSAVARERLAAS